MEQKQNGLRTAPGERMEPDFEGTLVLEKLAAIDKVDEFLDAVDSDDVARASRLMRAARVDATTIATVVRKIEDGDSDH